MEESKVQIKVSREPVHGSGGLTGTVCGGEASIVIPRSSLAFGFSIGSIRKVLRPPLMTSPRGGARVYGWVCGDALTPPLLR
jgi:hypothetical protein